MSCGSLFPNLPPRPYQQFGVADPQREVRLLRAFLYQQDQERPIEDEIAGGGATPKAGAVAGVVVDVAGGCGFETGCL